MRRILHSSIAALVLSVTVIGMPAASAAADPTRELRSSPSWENMCHRLGSAVEAATGSLELGINTYVACMANMPA